MPLSPAPSRSSRSSVIKTTEIGFAGVEGALRHFGGVTEEVLLAEQMTIRLTRDHGFADSPLEGRVHCELVSEIRCRFR